MNVHSYIDVEEGQMVFETVAHGKCFAVVYGIPNSRQEFADVSQRAEQALATRIAEEALPA